MKLGSGDFTYDWNPSWAKLPAGWYLKWIGGVATDSKNRVYVFNRGNHPLIVFDREGNVLTTWDHAYFNHAHAVYIDGEDNVWLTDRYAQVVWKFDTRGTLLATIGTVCAPGASGAPFHDPTQAARAPNGDVYVSDGYVNSRVHRFSPEGKLIHSWGEPGQGPGQFRLPHAVWVDGRQRVWVADRENNRIQFFNLEGGFLYEWPDYRRPADFYMDQDGIMYVAELDAGVAIVDMDGKMLARFGEHGDGPDQFKAPHGIWADSHGDIYVCEVQADDRMHKLERI